MEPKPLLPKSHFSEEGLENIVGFYEVLLRVHNRLVLEGYVFKDGKIKPPPGVQMAISKKGMKKT